MSANSSTLDYLISVWYGITVLSRNVGEEQKMFVWNLGWLFPKWICNQRVGGQPFEILTLFTKGAKMCLRKYWMNPHIIIINTVQRASRGCRMHQTYKYVKTLLVQIVMFKKDLYVIFQALGYVNKQKIWGIDIQSINDKCPSHA